MNHIYSAGIITYIIEKEGPKYLLLHYTSGHWDFPKGTMEPHETKKETATRELYEETGLTADIDTQFESTSHYFYKHAQGGIIPKTVYYFVGKTDNKNVILSHEHTDYQWLSYEQALKKITYDASRTILEEAHQYIIAIT